MIRRSILLVGMLASCSAIPPTSSVQPTQAAASALPPLTRCKGPAPTPPAWPRGVVSLERYGQQLEAEAEARRLNSVYLKSCAAQIDALIELIGDQR